MCAASASHSIDDLLSMIATAVASEPDVSDVTDVSDGDDHIFIVKGNEDRMPCLRDYRKQEVKLLFWMHKYFEKINRSDVFDHYSFRTNQTVLLENSFANFTNVMLRMSYQAFSYHGLLFNKCKN
jgi:hypothetical protein